ncbi:monoamine oxidase [Haematobacter missouriensis]|uniref:Monoamine oxidase n=1 Tax=Haematobacter missouriensis TaxID=366616 RepID=A0ABX3ZP39_9RHOB|nr:MaoC family dehydratase [Haematobacter missouriensis]KFI33498.1 monoamine oxidase [Haematobacter missouriensis]OWJ71918.1 monoamine oxidase [Haematobacter missouriensis]
MSLFYEDVQTGASYTTPVHRITETDIADFCRLTRDHHPLHTDAAYARGAGFPGIIAHGLYGLALMEGLKTELHLYDESSIASLGWDKVRFRTPLLANDIVHVEMDFVAKRESRGRGVVTEAVRLMRGADVVMDAEHVSLIRIRG